MFPRRAPRRANTKQPQVPVARRKKLGSGDMPALLYGTAWKKERTAGLVTQALAAGFEGLDTATARKHYDEPRVGEGAFRRAGLLKRASRAALRQGQHFLDARRGQPSDNP